MKKQNYKPTGWQLNASSIETETVQYWANGIMLTAQMTKQTAIEKVNNGSAFVISSQAIGSMINEISNA